MRFLIAAATGIAGVIAFDYALNTAAGTAGTVGDAAKKVKSFLKR